MNFNLKLDGQELDTIVTALGELPAKVVMPLLAKIHEQANEQAKAQEQPKPE